jgi:redox-sensitive bicupin YhaK (pirin superfamily)
MIILRKSNERGHANHGWLEAYHTFSFANYYDPNFTGFRDLVVINEDRVQGGAGFPTHGHQDMEIITYIIEGALQHKDSMGNTAIIKPGEVQHMSAGTGVRHSEFNPLPDQLTHLLQIWIQPDEEGIKPKYGQKSFEQEFKTKNFVLVASKDGHEGSLPISQDVKMYVGKFAKGERKEYPLASQRNVWIQVVKGALLVNENKLETSDGLAAFEEKSLHIIAQLDSEFLLFDLP